MPLSTPWVPHPPRDVLWRIRRVNMPATTISNNTSFDIVKTILEGGPDFSVSDIHVPLDFSVVTAIEPIEDVGPGDVGIIRLPHTPLRAQSLGVRVKASITQNGTDGVVVALRRNLIADPNEDPLNRTFFLRSQDAQDGAVAEFLPSWAKGPGDPFFNGGFRAEFDNNTGQAFSIVAGSTLEVLIIGSISQPEADV